jgi:tetratricopeptide (TPR) repeat protein
MKNKKIPDKRSMEKTFADMQKIMNSKQFGSLEEAQTFMGSLVGKTVPEFDGPLTPAEQAQELIYDAHEKKSAKDRILLAYKALHIYPDCPDAYCLLAEEEAKNDTEALELYMKAEAAGRRQLGEEFIKKEKGELWMHYPARPYMRAMEGLANILWNTGKKDEAINICREMLELNTGDNQGIRYLLCTYLCGVKRYGEADTLMNAGKYMNDSGIEWYYNRPLVEFVLRGDTQKARALVHLALKRNIHVIAFMSGASEIPKYTPEMYSPGSIEEAVIYVHFNIESWLASREVFTWFMDTVNDTLQKHGPELETQLAGKQKPVLSEKKPGRNEPCPCGSGKKYKKCCGEA